jgi:hypothetical protein
MSPNARNDMARESMCPWQLLEDHFRYHARVVNHFRSIDALTAVVMWETGCNAAGERLSQFERDALVERCCELFGSWPK